MKTFLPLFLLLLFTKSFGQAPGIMWSKDYTDSYEIWGWDGEMHQTSDSGFVFCGTDDQSPTTNIPRGIVVKTDAQGDTIWSKHYLFGVGCVFRAIKEIPGGYVVGGAYNYYGNGYLAFMMKLDYLGNVVTWNGFGCGPNTYTMMDCVQRTNDGGYLFGGVTNCDSLVNESKLIKTDSNLVVQWTQHYGRFGNGGIIDMAKTPDGGCLAVVYLSLGSITMKVNSSGVPLWTKSYGDSIFLTHIEILPDSGYIASVHRTPGQENTFIIRLDSLADSLWMKRYNLSAWEEKPFWIKPTPDGGFFMTGYTMIGTSIQSRLIFAMKTDQNGDSLWMKVFSTNTSDGDIGICCDITYDTGYVIKGIYVMYNRYNLVKLKEGVEDPLGITSNTESVITISPNPCSDELFINFENNTGEWNIMLFDVLGKVVYSGNSSAQFSRIDMQHLSSGIYVLKLSDEHQTVTRKVLKQ